MTDKELRELDAWIAGCVMGWKLVSGTKFKIKPDEYFVHSVLGVVLSGNESNPFCPTTDPAAAMMVLEKCVEKVNVEFGSVDIDGQ